MLIFIYIYQQINHMKLLLTSAGITNKSIARALFELTGKPAEETALVFIPTASNIEIGDKSWLIEDLIQLKELNFKSIDIADISVINEKIWKQKIDAADIIYFEGGNNYHLMESINKSGLISMLPDLLQTKVYVGVSAGSMITSKKLSLLISQSIYEEDRDKSDEVSGLKLIDFYVLPHLNSPYFEKVREGIIKDITEEIKDAIYALDDDSAIKVIDDQIEVISEGQWLLFNK